MTPEERNISKINRLLSLMESDGLTERKFLEHFQVVVDLIKQLKIANRQEMDSLDSKYTSVVNSIQSGYSGDMDSLKSKAMDYCMAEMSKLMGKVEAKMAEVQNGLDGKDADEARVAEIATKQAITEVLKSVPTIEAIEADLPKLGKPIRDALELLEGDERLTIDAIKDLREELEALKGKSTQVGNVYSGGFNYASIDVHFVDDETPTGLVNGVNKDFVLSLIPSPASSLKVFVNGQRVRLTEDFTFSGQTISFITAPLTGSIILVDYRC